MDISRNWLTQYVAVDCDIPTLCDKLTMAGIEVEAVESAGTVPAGVVVGRILERKPHPASGIILPEMIFCNWRSILISANPQKFSGKSVKRQRHSATLQRRPVSMSRSWIR